jgi:hypothetical protein
MTSCPRLGFPVPLHLVAVADPVTATEVIDEQNESKASC